MTAREWVDVFSDAVTDDTHDGLLLVDGFDDCIVGIGQRFTDYAVIYDFDRVLARLMSDDMTRDEAIEFHERHHLGALVGDRTPIFLHFPPTEHSR